MDEEVIDYKKLQEKLLRLAQDSSEGDRQSADEIRQLVEKSGRFLIRDSGLIPKRLLLVLTILSSELAQRAKIKINASLYRNNATMAELATALAMSEGAFIKYSLTNEIFDLPLIQFNKTVLDIMRFNYQSH